MPTQRQREKEAATPRDLGTPSIVDHKGKVGGGGVLVVVVVVVAADAAVADAAAESKWLCNFSFFKNL